MKKTLTSFLLIILISGALFSQGIYIRGGGGYGLPIATSSLGTSHIRTDFSNGSGTTYSNSNEIVTGSYGAGINFNFAVGYKFNENFIFELGTQYLMSKKYKTFDNYSYTYLDPLNASSYVDNNKYTSSAKALFLNPSFIFSAGFGKAAPYGRFGLVLGSPKISGSELSYYNGDGIDSVSRKWEYTKGISLGFQGAIGMNWKISDKLDFYTELNYVSMTYYPGEYNVTEYLRSYGGPVVSDLLPNMYMSQKQTIFKRKFDPTTVNTDFAKARVDFPQSMPLSSLSLQVGLRFSLFNLVK
jgi:hypothetical protein